MKGKTVFVIGTLMSLVISVLSIVNNEIGNCFFPFAISGVCLLELTSWHGLKKAAFAQGFIATASLLTGVSIGNTPPFVPGISYFLVSVTIPLAIVAIMSYKQYLTMVRRQGKTEGRYS